LEKVAYLSTDAIFGENRLPISPHPPMQRIEILLLLLPCLTGCFSSAKSELRGLSPVEVRVVRDGNPVEGVLVALYSDGPQGAVGSSALTNSSGVAILKSTVQSTAAKGVKPGSYKVALTKETVWPSELSDFEGDQRLSEPERSAMQRKREDFLNKNRIIPKALESPETTAVTLDVKPKEKNSFTVDLAKY
jgi:hypothetical protein